MPLGAQPRQQIEAQKPLLEVAHERDIPVIFSTVIYEEADIKDAGIWALKQKGARTLTAGSEAVKIDPRLERAAARTSCWSRNTPRASSAPIWCRGSTAGASIR